MAKDYIEKKYRLKKEVEEEKRKGKKCVKYDFIFNRLGGNTVKDARDEFT